MYNFYIKMSFKSKIVAIENQNVRAISNKRCEAENFTVCVFFYCASKKKI